MDDNAEAADEVEEDQYWIYTGEEEVPDDVTHVRVSGDVTGLRARAFINLERLVAVEVNEGLREVGERAFYSCSSLECVRFPSSVKTFGIYAFGECKKLNHVEFPENSRLEDIMGGAFDGCKSLTEITLPKTLRNLGGYAFKGCSRLTRVDLANTALTTIKDSTFCMCRSLEDVRLPVTIKAIGRQAFRDCTGLSTIILHEGIKTINDSAFLGCKNLSIYQLPSTVEIIGGAAFRLCNLRHFVSPLRCREVDLSAFSCCGKLKSIQIAAVDDTRLNRCRSQLPSLLRMNIPKSFSVNGGVLYSGGSGMFCPGQFLSNVSIEPNSSMSKNEYRYMFPKFKEKGCDLDRMKSRFKQLPLHKICFDYSNQHTDVTFEQVLECL